MAKSKIDGKEFMLQYGDRIGLGVAGFLALLFVIFAIMGGGSGVSAEQVKESGKKADEAIKRSVINPDKIALKDDPSVKPLDQIDALSKSLIKPVVMDQLTLMVRFFEPTPLQGRFRSNPVVMQALEVVAVPLVGAIRLYETRVVNKVEEVMVVTPRSGVTPPKNAGGGNLFRPGGAGNMPGGPAGAGPGRGGLGGAGSGMGLPDGGLGGGRGGNKSGSGGQSTGNTKSSAKPPVGNPGADETMYTFNWNKDVKSEDILGVTIRPLRSAYIAATFPHSKQTEEIAKKLQLQKHEAERERFYRRIDVQRRRIILAGSPLPDGTLATVEMVEIENPRDRTKKEYKLPADVDKLAAAADDQMSEKERSALAGWDDVNIVNVAAVMMSAYSVTKSNNEGFYVEKEPLIEGLVEYAGPRMAMRLPRMVRSEYPDVMSKLAILMGAVRKIKEDEKAKIPPPPRDSRLNTGAGEEFDKLAGYDDPNKDKDKGKPGDAPELSGPIPEYIPIRFIDVDLPADSVGGATYEYRLRVVLNNPNHKREKDVAAPEFARDETLSGPWSPIARVTFEPDSLIFAGERERAKGSTDDREKDKVPVQLHKWLGKVEAFGGSDRTYEIVGDWWIERLLIGRGEYIGRSPDLAGPAGESNLVQWVSHAFDIANQKIGGDVQKKTRTPDLYSSSILVDFHGGAYHSFRSDVSKGSKREDVPAELLILEPDGRLIARHVADDRNEEGRKQRYDQWKTWLDRLGKPGDKKPAGSGAGGSGPSKD